MPEKYANDVTMTRKPKRQTNLVWNIFRDVTSDHGHRRQQVAQDRHGRIGSASLPRIQGALFKYMAEGLARKHSCLKVKGMGK
jgi:hypothetical protein